MLPFAPEGYPFVLVPALAGILAWVFGYPRRGAVSAGSPMLACVAFFRDPARAPTPPPEVVLAPADGKVLSVGAAPATLAAHRAAAADLDLHVARPTCTSTGRRSPGPCARSATSPGAKFPAFRDKASELNEHSFVLIEGDGGHGGLQADRRLAGAPGGVRPDARPDGRARRARRADQVRLARGPLPAGRRGRRGEPGQRDPRRRHRRRALRRRGAA